MTPHNTHSHHKRASMTHGNMKKEYTFDKKDVHYILKGWVSDKAKYIKVPHCPWFNSEAEAREFYTLNKEYETFYMWTKFKDLSVFKMYPRPDDELVEII
jgi:hypothetical protein